MIKKITYGKEITYTDFLGNKKTVGVSGCFSADEAEREALLLAKSCGWTTPKWWQWWRWNDTKLSDR